MKSLFVILFLASLAGNAVLAVFALRSSAPAASAVISPITVVPAPTTTAPAVTEKAGVASAPATWQAFNPGANLHDLVTNLRSAGFPSGVVRAIANQMITDRLGTTGIDQFPFWERNPNNPKYLAVLLQLSNQRREMLTDLLGADARPSATIDPVSREHRYGALSDEKVDQIESITRDYQQMRSNLFAAARPGDVQSQISTNAAMEEELRRELSAILTPAELEQYEMRSSQSARRLMTNLKSIDITEAEYTALFRAQQAFDAADPMRNTGVASSDTMVRRFLAQEQLNAQARAILSDDRFYEYLRGADANYAMAARFTANYPDVTPAMTYELTQIERDYQTSMMTMNRDGAAATDRMARIAAVRKEYQDKLNTLLGPETAKAYANRNRPGATATRTGP